MLLPRCMQYFKVSHFADASSVQDWLNAEVVPSTQSVALSEAHVQLCFIAALPIKGN